MPKKEIVTEIEGQKVKLSNLDKVLFPGVNVVKAALIQYYIKHAETVLRFLARRPLTLIRYPDGINATKFYSKNRPEWTPEWIASFKEDGEDTIDYVMANNAASLVWMANLATLELHPMQVKGPSFQNPDHFIFDLDPPPDSDFSVVKELALLLKPFLEQYGYRPFIKTSGGKGLHIYVPVNPVYAQPEVFECVKGLAQEFVKKHNWTTLRMSKERRKGKVLLDIYRNHKSQTCVAPYSTRGKQGAPISTPIKWEHLETLTSSAEYNILNIDQYIDSHGDLWKDFKSFNVDLHTHKEKSIHSGLHDLDVYQSKRNFEKTNEPHPNLESITSGDNYVIQIHDASNLHYDLRLEENGVLLSWAIPKGLPRKSGIKRLAIETEPHPLRYLDFEGVIPKGEYGGGTMWVFDRGKYDLIKRSKNKLSFILKEGKMAGNFVIYRTKDAQWIIEKKSELIDDLTTYKDPMLAKLAHKIPPASKYSYEIKWDGIRGITVIDEKEKKIFSRNGNDISSKFPKLVEALSDVEAMSAVVDGEIVHLNADGSPNFSKIVGRMHTKDDGVAKVSKSTPAAYYLYDLLYLDGRDIRKEPLERRREWLKTILKVGPYIRLSEDFPDGKALFGAAEKHGLEGIMCKKKGAAYISGSRSDNWLKVKVQKEAEVWIIGYTVGQGDRSKVFGALHLAEIENDKYTYMGKVGTGFTSDNLKSIFKQLKKIPILQKPIKEKIEDEPRTVWIAPQLKCEIKYASLSSNRTFREPVFLKLVY